MFERKQKNRRLNRIHVLDVKLRSDQVRKSRMRLAVLAFGVLFGTLFGAYVLWRTGGWALNKLVYENQAFAIKQVEVQNTGLITPDQLRRWANVKIGENLLALDLARVKRDLEMVPAVGTVSIERILPGTLRIRVTEREAIAQVTPLRTGTNGVMEHVVYHVDADGFVMVPVDPRQRVVPFVQTDDALPILSCLNQNELVPGRQIRTPQTTAALNLISLFALSPMAGLVDLRRIDATSPDVLVVHTGQGSEITFGLNDLEHQLRRWREIHDLGMRLKRNVASIDLAVSNNVPIRWLEATFSPAPAKPPKTTRTRKRNV
ncbi:MAG TPA: FtsQ-type POTRA domain-containing protein [Verrucomicrobiae bacterium]|nr:FtsQ-type POTRA domain-containing protein [Verrucomicrobiae bacterium]